MSPSYGSRWPVYAKQWDAMQLTKPSEIEAAAQRILANKARYQAVEKVTGVPWYWIGPTHLRESDLNFKTQLAQGDPLDRVSTHVPRGLGPYRSWEEAAIDILLIKEMQRVSDWRLEKMIYFWEAYNGWGYYNHGVPSPYVWGASNQQRPGKYVADGVWDDSVMDRQLGCASVLRELMRLDPSIKVQRESTEISKAPPQAEPNLAERIISAMRAAGQTIFTGTGEMNIAYVEGLDPNGQPNDNKPNRFNDLRTVITFRDGVPLLVGAWEATTEPSAFWTKNPMNSGGAARIKFGQYKAWQVGVHNGNHEALVQTGGKVTVCRDLNKDFRRTGDREDTGYFGINQHWGYDLPKDDLGHSSAGCLVGRTKQGHREFMALLKTDPRYAKNKQFIFTTAVMPASALFAAKIDQKPTAPEAKPAKPPINKPVQTGISAIIAAIIAWFSHLLLDNPFMTIIAAVLAALIVFMAIDTFKKEN